ncbi:hypothetical protein BJ322DRAFT_1009786 [Thelephora terrestris]|uniref:Mitochondrial import inner membrane translocase subunit TIM50 n=1 Tax=Thelephora terrestris TaxID=56493 RepID=A0A9P6L448_9AGAM|nr:hypothetical protein BJ322DRAFT_1009786 [Thelephora terrestris]
MNQSWWFNTFGKQQEPRPKAEEALFASTSSDAKNDVRNEFPLEPKSYDSDYREYQPSQRPPFPASRARSRTATPPPLRGPSSEYVAASDGPSDSLDDPSSSRKLLVLDLNGTLLHRSPRAIKGGSRYPMPGQQGFRPRLRSVHSRPYMPSFKSYIFHPSTKGWLDVMVWSSAQPHSVDDMVDKCFYDEKHHFVAVWARDTLGLPQHLYNRKVQTLKDLNIPWSKLFPPSDLPAAKPSPTSHHNALSTLLMDDSPLKAELQPYNHLCVKEYSNVIRNRDLASLQEERARPKPPPFTPPQHALHSQPYPNPPLMDAPAHSMPPAQGDPSAETTSVETEASLDPPFPTSPSNKRKRKVKQETERETSGADPTHVIEYDETLLAIVGILDEVKFQSNVASWVKANGLWGPHPPHNTSATNTDALTHKQVRKSSEDVATSSDSGRPGEGKKKRRDAVASFFEAAAPQWFDSPPTVRHWVNRGRKALETLGIPIEHGLRQ